MHLKAGTEEEYQKYVQLNSDDDYSKGVVDYGERWADLMEARLAAGEELTQMADTTSHEADTEGITGFMYGCAVKALAHFWHYGEELRQWHNLKTQLRQEGERANREGGVLNPALLNISIKD